MNEPSWHCPFCEQKPCSPEGLLEHCLLAHSETRVSGRRLMHGEHFFKSLLWCWCGNLVRSKEKLFLHWRARGSPEQHVNELLLGLAAQTIIRSS